jgi:hypothetical protein
MSPVPSPISVPILHAVPLLVTGMRGGRRTFASDETTTLVTIPGTDPASLTPATLNHGSYSMDVVSHAGRHWLAVRHGDPATGRAAGVASLEDAAKALGLGWRERRGRPSLDLQGLSGPPFSALAAPALRFSPDLASVPSRVPPAEMEAGLALARRAVDAHAATDLVHDGTTLYRALDAPLVYPRTVPRTAPQLLWCDLAAPGVLPHRIAAGGTFPHTARGTGLAAYGENVRTIRRHLLSSQEGIDHRDADIVEFANDIPSGMLSLLRRGLSAHRPTLRRFEDGLWSLMRAGSVRALRGDDLLPAVETIREAAAAMHAAANGWKTKEALGSLVAFSDAVALPVLRTRTPLPDADVESLGALTP